MAKPSAGRSQGRDKIIRFPGGTRIYRPTPSRPYHRIYGPVVDPDDPTGTKPKWENAPDAATAQRIAEEREAFLATGTPVENADSTKRTVARLADLYLQSLAARGCAASYIAKREYHLRCFVVPALGAKLVAHWSPADSERVLTKARRTLGRWALQDLGTTMRGLVTQARKERWLIETSHNPMWEVSYSAEALVQGEDVTFIDREDLPDDQQCRNLFKAFDATGQHGWSIGTELAYRSGVRWGELCVLHAGDVNVAERSVLVERAYDKHDKSVGPPKNGTTRKTMYPASFAERFEPYVEQALADRGPDGLLFPAARGGIQSRTHFQSKWIRAAMVAGWPMVDEPTQDAQYHWRGRALWTPHDLRHVAACWMLFDVKLDPALVCQLLGHADASFTVKRYVGVRGKATALAFNATADW